MPEELHPLLAFCLAKNHPIRMFSVGPQARWETLSRIMPVRGGVCLAGSVRCRPGRDRDARSGGFSPVRRREDAWRRPRGVAPVGASCAKEKQEQMFHVKHLDRAGGVGGTRLGGRSVRGAAPGREACAADAGGGGPLRGGRGWLPLRGGRAGCCPLRGGRAGSCDGRGVRAAARAGHRALRLLLGDEKISRGLQILLNRVQFPFC